MLQASWDAQPVFIHCEKKAPRKQGNQNVPAKKLSYLTIIRALLDDSSDQTPIFVFHAQSSLPYLVFARWICLLIAKRSPIMVYDMHDLHEKRQHYPTQWQHLRYGWLRHGILQALERIAFKDSRVRKITVSTGLAKVVSERYRFPEPTVVRSVPPTTWSAKDLSEKSLANNALLYFGTPNHLPVELFDRIPESGYELHFYGRGITPSLLTGICSAGTLSSFQCFGPYSPDDLSFLLEYRYLVLYRPHDRSTNYRFSLPNKLFQGMNAGLSFIVSENFEELTETLKNVPGSVFVLKEGGSIKEAVDALEAARPPDYCDRILNLTRALHEEAKRAYLNATRRELSEERC
jgi:hypothetical protein